jgi:diguanylate cyclase
MNLRVLERQSLEHGLRHALERRELVLHFQPIVDLQTNLISGVEALIRWSHPKRGLLLAAQFVPIAKESGLLMAVGRWVLHEVCREAREWLDAGLLPARVAVNISAAELRDRDFVDGVRAVLQETGIPPNVLELELTESFLMQDAKSTLAVLRALKETGVQLALDDFGSGYSGLGHLKRFPIDTLKIDRGFVHNLTTDPGDAGIVAGVIGIAKSLHMRVVAEGVETPEQLAFLRQHSCSEGQGNYFSRPRIAREVTRLLERRSMVASSHLTSRASFERATTNGSDP